MKRPFTMSRGNSPRDGDRGGGPAGEWRADGQSVAGGSIPQPPSKAGDLPNHRKIKKPGPLVIGPGDVRADKKGAARHDPALTRVDLGSGGSAVLGRGGEAMPETDSRSSRPASRRTNVDPQTSTTLTSNGGSASTTVMKAPHPKKFSALNINKKFFGYNSATPTQSSSISTPSSTKVGIVNRESIRSNFGV